MPERFQNPFSSSDHGILDILRWKTGLLREPASMAPAAPDEAARSVRPDLELLQSPVTEGWRATWLGHNSWLLQTNGRTFLLDPIFSDYCSPVPLPGLKRLQSPPLRADELPPVDFILLTHSHYDHLDLPSLKSLGQGLPLFVAQGHGNWLKRKGFTKVTEVPVGTNVAFEDITIHATPAQHFTARTPFDRNRGHWCGWLIEAESQRIYCAGDTAYAPYFENIRERHGAPDLSLIPIGAYQPASIMRTVHLNPPEALRAHLELQSKLSLATHWGTFRLTDEPLGEPPLWLEEECRKQEITNFKVLKIGETLIGT